MAEDCFFEMQMMKKTKLFVVFFLFVCCNYFSQRVITLSSLLKKMTNFETVTEFPSPAYTLKQVSSYDGRSISPDKPGWFANYDFSQYVQTESRFEHKEHVMLDVDGPGVIVRFWLTSTENRDGILRIYFDKCSKPAIKIPGYDILKSNLPLVIPHSSYEQNGKGGSTMYCPLPYAKHCKITWEEFDTLVNPPRYYQINYRTYGTGTKVETFNLNQLAKCKADIDKAEITLWHPALASGNKIRINQIVNVNHEATIVLPHGSNAVRALTILMSADNKTDNEKMWCSVLLKVEFDGRQTIMCPLGDFIGSGYGGKEIKSWYRDLKDSGVLVSRWVMPYQKTAKISFINKNNFDVNINAAATVSSFKWNSATMYFHAVYKYEENIKDAKWDYDITKIPSQDPSAPIDWNFVTIKGKGVYMGNTLSVNNHMNSWYGEGDAKVYVDHETFPSEFGTGLEDYYNTSWAPVVLYQTPFANAPRADNPSSTGLNTFTRTCILDAIPFTKTFSFNMEMLSWNGGIIDAATTTYWYETSAK